MDARWSGVEGDGISPYLRWLGVACLLTYALCRIWFGGVGKAMEVGFLAMTLLLMLTSHRRMALDTYFKFVLLAVLVQLIPWCLGMLAPTVISSPNPHLDRLTKIFFFFATAILLAGRLRNVFWLWGIAALGLLFAVLGSSADWLLWQQGMAGLRVDFGIRNAQHVAMYFGTLMLGCLCFSQRWLAAGPRLWWRLPLWLGTLAVAALGIMVTQTRAIFLAIFLALLLALVFWIWLKRPRCWLLGLLLAATALLCVTLGERGIAHVEQRYEQEAPVIQQLLRGDWGDIPYTSVGIRANTWKVAAEKIMERPWFGWGSQARSRVIAHSDALPDWVKQQFGHLHNYFLEVQLSYGLAGTLLLVALAGAIGRDCWLTWRAGLMPTDVLVFGFCFFVFWVIVNNFESYMSFGTGTFVFNIIVGGLVTLCWRRRYPRGLADAAR
ncbi:O-antigen ligase family protein [Aeromonas bivalvium]|uniref:O-antigen ligase family protein n=1 Tax=Aeromonas bivalvium TaxID=440079 RepID=UPI0038D21828